MQLITTPLKLGEVGVASEPVKLDFLFVASGTGMLAKLLCLASVFAPNR